MARLVRGFATQQSMELEAKRIKLRTTIVVHALNALNEAAEEAGTTPERLPSRIRKGIIEETLIEFVPGFVALSGSEQDKHIASVTTCIEAREVFRADAAREGVSADADAVPMAFENSWSNTVRTAEAMDPIDRL